MNVMPNLNGQPIAPDAGFQELLTHVMSGLVMIVTTDCDGEEAAKANALAWDLRQHAIEAGLTNGQDTLWAVLLAAALLLTQPETMQGGGAYDSDLTEALRRFADHVDARRKVHA